MHIRTPVWVTHRCSRVRGVRVEEITAVAQDYLKVIWTATEWGGPSIATKALADRFGTTQANVSKTVKRLADQGLVEYHPYRPVLLTARGSELALAMVRRHRLVETFLVTTLGYGWNEVHDEAERLEHAVSDTMIDRIDQLLGHPEADPHGDPIPRPDGTLPRPVDTIRLQDAGPGKYTVVRISDTDPDVLDRLRVQSIHPGTVIQVEADATTANIMLATGPSGHHLSENDAAAIRVRSAGRERWPSAREESTGP